MSYREFSYFQDYFNYNADYDTLFRKIVSLAKEGGVSSGIVCDLGCGTGELAFRFNDAGFDVIAVDNSDEMLDVLFLLTSFCNCFENKSIDKCRNTTQIPIYDPSKYSS